MHLFRISPRGEAVNYRPYASPSADESLLQRRRADGAINRVSATWRAVIPDVSHLDFSYLDVSYLGKNNIDVTKRLKGLTLMIDL